METTFKVLFKQNILFYLLISLLFILLKTQEYQNEIILKTKGPLFCDDITNEYCYKKNYPFNIEINNSEYINIINLKWNEGITNFSYMFYECDNILEVDLNLTYLNGDSYLEYMFSNCISLTSINLFNINLNLELSSDINLYLKNMFSNCSLLTFINTFNSKYYFNTECSREIPLKSFDIENYNYSCSINNINNTFCLFDDDKYFNREKMFNYILRELQDIIINESNFNEDEYITIKDHENNFKYIIISNKNKKYNYEFTNINFTQCENNMKVKNEIPNGECIYLLIITKTKNESTNIITEYEIYYFFDQLKIKDTCNFELKKQKEEQNNNCPKDFYFILISNNKCIKYCYIQDRLDNKCINRYNINETHINKTLVDEIQNVILMGIKNEMINKNFILSYLEKEKYLMIEEEGTKFIITSYNYQLNNLEDINMTNIDLDKCEAELRNSYGIMGDIYILKIDKELEGLKVPKIEYELYALLKNNNSNYKLQLLNLSICDGIKIYVYIPLPFNLPEDKYDIYDLKSGYYDNICYTNTINDKFDISLPEEKMNILKII